MKIFIKNYQKNLTRNSNADIVLEGVGGISR